MEARPSFDMLPKGGNQTDDGSMSIEEAFMMNSEDFVDPYVFYFDGIALTTVSTLGLIGTSMSIVVLLKPRIRDFFSSFLTALSAFDCIFLLVAIVYLGLPAISAWFGHNVYARIVPICHGTLHIARTGSVYVTMAVTIERYFAIVHPLKDFKLKKALLPLAVAFAVLYNVPKFFEMEVYDFKLGPIEQKDVRKTNMRRNPYYATYYVFWSKVVFMEIIPYCMIVILNGFIISKIYSSYKFRRQFVRKPGEKRLSIPVINTEHHEPQASTTTSTVNGLKSTRSSSLTNNGITSPRQKSIKPSASVGNLKQIQQPEKSEPILVVIQPEEEEAELALIDDRQKSYAMTLNNPSLSRTPSRSPSRMTSTPPNLNNKMAASNHLLKPHEIDLALTLIAISLMFIVCQSVKVIPDIYEMVECDHFELAAADNDMDQMCQMSSTFIDFLVSLGNLFCCLNSACNFLFYMLRGKKFRDAFCQTYFCKKDRFRPTSPTGASMHTTDPNTRYTTSLLATNVRTNHGSSTGGRRSSKKGFV